VDVAVDTERRCMLESCNGSVTSTSIGVSGGLYSISRQTQDATEVEVTTEDGDELVSVTYSLSDPAARQSFYQAILSCNPYNIKKPAVEHVRSFFAIIDSATPVPHVLSFPEEDQHKLFAFVLQGEDPAMWEDALRYHFDSSFECREELVSNSNSEESKYGPHKLITFTHDDLAPWVSNCQSSELMGAETNSSCAVTCWIGETSIAIYASNEREYEDCYIGSWQLDLHQFRHFVAMGSTVTKSIGLSGSEIAKKTCDRKGDKFVWRSSPDSCEGCLTETPNFDAFTLGDSVSLEIPCVIPVIQQKGKESHFVLVIDNLRATGVSTEDNEAAYVYIGAQFCEDRRTSSKSGTNSPVWQFVRDTNGQSQNSIEVLQMPTYVSDINYLQTQRLMIAVMDDNKQEDDPMIGYGFLSLKKVCEELDTAHDFTLELTFFMQATCSMTGRISCHRMESTVGTESTSKQQKKSDSGGNRDLIKSYFRRYDLDESGTINSSEELQQLCTNLSVRLELQFSLAEIDAKITGAGSMEDNNWTLEDFVDWFSKEFEVEVQ